MNAREKLDEFTEMIGMNKNQLIGWSVTADFAEWCAEQVKNCSIPAVVKRIERGWAGHFICSNRCRFRRNTLLTYKDIKIVVSTVGLMEGAGEFETVGSGRYFETMAFHSDLTDKRYYDADVSQQVYFDSACAIAEIDADDKANEMHEAVVAEISTKLEQGYRFERTE